ncbi:MAG: DUF1326 domain-containing protein [Pseudomonadota bacterium]
MANALTKTARSRALKVLEDDDQPIPSGAQWKIKGELALSCSCELFCPCVISLGQHPPTHGFCHAWIAARIDKGRYGPIKLNGLNICLLVDIPGKMGAGNWTVALYIDETATDQQFAALEKIFTGAAKGTTGLFRLLVGNYLGARREPVEYETEGELRRISAGRAVFGEVTPIGGASEDHYVTVENTSYWMGPTVIVAQAGKSKIRDFGRVWNFDGGSGEICEIEWSGP